MQKVRLLGQSVNSAGILHALCYLPLFFVLFVPTTSFLPEIMPVEVWYKWSLAIAILFAILSGRMFTREVFLFFSGKRWFFWLLVFIGWVALLWIFQSDNVSEDWDIKYWLIPVGLVFFLWIASPKFTRVIAACFLIVGLINSLAGFGTWVGYHFDPSLQTPISPDLESGAAGYGWYYWIGGGIPPVAGLRGTVSINGMADLLFWPFMIFLGYSVSTKSRWPSILGMAITALGIFATYSRSTAVVMPLGLVIFLFLRKRMRISVSRRVIAVFITLAILLLLVMLLFLPRPLVGSFISRFDVWQRILIYLQDFPATLLIGGGFPQIIFYPYEVWDSHSIYLYLLVAYGIPGLLLFLIPLLFFIRKSWGRIRDILQSPMEAHASAAIAALICFLIRGIAESQVNEIDWRMAFVLFFSYAAGTIHGEDDAPMQHLETPTSSTR